MHAVFLVATNVVEPGVFTGFHFKNLPDQLPGKIRCQRSAAASSDEVSAEALIGAVAGNVVQAVDDWEQTRTKQ